MQAGSRVQRGLTSANKQQTLIQLGATVLGDLLQIHGSLDLLANELLDFIDHQQRAGQIAVCTKDLLEDVQCLSHGWRIDVGKLSTNCRLRIGGVGIIGIGVDKGFGERQRES